jgi:hypothetical protein
MDTEVKDELDEFFAVVEEPAALHEWEARHKLNEELFERFLRRVGRLLQDRRGLAHRAVNYFLVKAKERNNLEWQGRLAQRKAFLLLYDEDFHQALEMSTQAISILEGI